MEVLLVLVVLLVLIGGGGSLFGPRYYSGYSHTNVWGLIVGLIVLLVLLRALGVF